jgi:hypothetical protein
MIIGLITLIVYSLICAIFLKVTDGKITTDEYFKTFRVLWIIIIILGFALNLLGQVITYILGRLM